MLLYCTVMANEQERKKNKGQYDIHQQILQGHYNYDNNKTERTQKKEYKYKEEEDAYCPVV